MFWILLSYNFHKCIFIYFIYVDVLILSPILYNSFIIYFFNTREMSNKSDWIFFCYNLTCPLENLFKEFFTRFLMFKFYNDLSQDLVPRFKKNIISFADLAGNFQFFFIFVLLINEHRLFFFFLFLDKH